LEVAAIGRVKPKQHSVTSRLRLFLERPHHESLPSDSSGTPMAYRHVASTPSSTNVNATQPGPQCAVSWIGVIEL
jgi:hypothetical protein